MLPEGGRHVMMSPNMAVEGLTWRDDTGPGTMKELSNILVTGRACSQKPQRVSDY